MRYLLTALLFAKVIFCLGQEYRVPLFTYGGLPQGKEVQTLFNEAFVIGYSNEMKNPLWVCYRLGNVKGEYEEVDTGRLVKWERPYQFQIDNRTTAKVSHDDYTSSGYDRGHMAPDAAMQAQYGQSALLETYLMSNIIPQHRDLNRGIWANLESYVRKELSQEDERNKEVNDLYVITGPIFSSNSERLESGIPIPTHSYKIFAYKKGYLGTIKAVAFVFPQHPESNDFMTYLKSVDEIEELTGLDFYPELSETKQRNLESVKRSFALEEID